MTWCYRYVVEARLHPAVAFHFFKLRAVPQTDAAQRVVEQWLDVAPMCAVRHATDGFGNAVQWGGYTRLHDTFRVESCGRVELGRYVLPCAAPAPLFRQPSPLTAWDAELAAWAHHIIMGAPDDAARALLLMQATHDAVAYERFVTTNATTALEVRRLRRGVCQDFAHLMLAAARSAGLAARYAAGMAPGEGETHAWVEVWHGGAWHAYDPTRGERVAGGYLKLAVGRDAADCPLNRGRFYAWTQETLRAECHLAQEKHNPT